MTKCSPTAVRPSTDNRAAVTPICAQSGGFRQHILEALFVEFRRSLTDDSAVATGLFFPSPVSLGTPGGDDVIR